MLPNLEMMASDPDTPAIARILAMELMGYSSVSYAMSVISTYDLFRLTEALDVILEDDDETPEENIKEFGVCHEVTVMGMVIATAEGTFGDFLDMEPLELMWKMNVFMSMELWCRLEKEDYPELPQPTLALEDEDMEKLYDFLYNEDEENDE